MTEMTETKALVGEEMGMRMKWVSRRCCRNTCLAMTAVGMIMSIVMLILGLTMFQPKKPEMEMLSASVEGVSPRVSGQPPLVKLYLNLTLNTKILIKNPNHVGFKHGRGESLMFYRERQVGQAEIAPGNIPSRGSNAQEIKLTMQLDQMGSEISSLISDVMSGELAMDTTSKIAGRVNILGIRKHIVTTSRCHVVVALPAMQVQSQKCKRHAKF